MTDQVSPREFKSFDSVVYRPGHVTDQGWDPDTCLFHGEERGVVCRTQGDVVFVWFNGGSTAAACRRADLHADTREVRAPDWYRVFLTRRYGEDSEAVQQFDRAVAAARSQILQAMES